MCYLRNISHLMTVIRCVTTVIYHFQISKIVFTQSGSVSDLRAIGFQPQITQNLNTARTQNNPYESHLAGPCLGTVTLAIKSEGLTAPMPLRDTVLESRLKTTIKKHKSILLAGYAIG